MKLRNKMTDEIGELTAYYSSREMFAIKSNDKTIYYFSLADLCNEWEDYTPAEPLIKDEKIRKAVRAWAEMNDIRFVHMCSRIRKENARIVGQNALGRTFTMEIDNEYEIRVCFKDYKECYTIAELCGEEEE